jgi:Meiotically up-regulated gene 113
MKHYPHHIGDFDKATRISDLPMVYVITTPRFEFIKVGKSSSFKSRLSNIQSGCPLNLSLWCAIRTPRPTDVEATLHRLLDHCGTRGEWFAPSKADLDCVIEFCASTNANVKEVHRALLQA